MLEVAVIADDLTGAADTTVRFCPYLESVYLFPGNIPIRGEAPFGPAACGVHTASRGLLPQQAFFQARQEALRIREMSPRLVYKKVDSCMRGNAGAEVQALLEVFGSPCALIAPAHPEMGRTTLNGVHRVHGKPVAHTEMALDPVSPVNSSRLDELVAGTAGLKVAHVNLECLQKDTGHLEIIIQKALSDGVRHICFDALEMSHLERIAEVGLKIGALLVGSAGLATALARVRFGTPRVDKTLSARGRGPERHLLVVGSKSKRAGEQVDFLLKRLPVTHIAVPMGEPMSGQYLDASFKQAMESTTRYLLVTPQRQGVVEPSTVTASPAQIVRNLARAATLVMEKWNPQSLFLTGGDTAQAVMDDLEVGQIRLVQELLPGIVLGAVEEGPREGLLVITKAGSFGDADALARAMEALEGRPAQEN